jgi:hypothetical protein
VFWELFNSFPASVAIVNARPPVSEAELDTLQRETFKYFVREANPVNGLIIDKTEVNSPASIAATGLALPRILCRRTAMPHGFPL